MIFYIIMLSAVRNKIDMDVVWLSRMVSDIDRDYSHNDEARYIIGEAIAETCHNVICVPWVFPLG